MAAGGGSWKGGSFKAASSGKITRTRGSKELSKRQIVDNVLKRPLLGVAVDGYYADKQGKMFQVARGRGYPVIGTGDYGRIKTGTAPLKGVLRGRYMDHDEVKALIKGK